MINAVPQPSAGAPMPTAAPVTPPAAPETTSSLPPFEPPAAAPASQKPPKKGMPLKGVIGLLVLILTVVGAAAGFYLTQMNQDVRQQASVGDYCRDVRFDVVCTDGAQYSTEYCLEEGDTTAEAEWKASACAGHNGVNEQLCHEVFGICEDGTPVSGFFCTTTPLTNEMQWSKLEQLCAGHSGADPASPPTVGGPQPPVGIGGNTSCDPLSAYPGQTQPIQRCDTHVCTQGDTNNDGQCTDADTGHQYSEGSCTAGGCWGQRDYYTTGMGTGTDSICKWEFFGDPSSCGGGPGGDNPPGGNGEIPGIGHFDEITCHTISGWACDPDVTNQKVRVDFWIGINTPGDTGVNRPIGSVTANAPASPGKDATDIAAACGGDSARRFTFAIPEEYKSQTDKKIFAFVIDINKDGSTDDNNPQLTNSPKQIVSCVGPACASLSMSPAAPKYGEAVNLTCAQVAGATSYSFNVTAGGSVITPTITNNTATFNAIYTGSYQASCSIN